MGKKKPAPPPAPDYAAQAQAQGAANTNAAQQSAVLSNPNVYSPYGNQTVSYDIGPNGMMQPTVRQSLTPQAQAALDAQQNVQMQQAQLASQGMSQAQNILSTPFQYTGPDIQTSFGGYNPAQGSFNYDQARTGLDLSGVAKLPVNAGMTGQQAIMARLQPQIDQGNNSFQQQMANQGITPGGEAFNNAQRLQTQGNNDLSSQAALYGLGLDFQANQQGFNEALQQGNFYNQGIGQNYNQNMGAAGFYNQAQAQNYNQALGQANFGNNAAGLSLQQQLALRNQPLNEINALQAGSQIQAPQFQQYTGQNIAAAPIFAGAQAQGQYNTDIYGQQMAGYNSDMQALGQVAGSAMGMFSPIKFSDVRLKSNIVRVGTHPLGIGVYEYDIGGRRERGVMAHEVETVRPVAVLTGPDGYKMVNYGALH